MTMIRVCEWLGLVKRVSLYAICVPSGDQSGRGAAKYAMRVPSGETVGAMSAERARVTRLT